MKLWQKTTLISLCVLLIMMTAAITVITHIYADDLRSSDEQEVRQTIALVQTQMNNALMVYTQKYKDLTARSLTAYTFLNLVKNLQNASVSFSLTQDTDYVKQLSPYDVLSLLSEKELIEAASYSQGPEEPLLRKTSANNIPLLIGTGMARYNNKSYTLFLTMDVSDTEQSIRHFRGLCLLILGSVILLTSILLSLFLRASLKPVGRLTETALEISKGRYDLRTSGTSSSEIKDLSEAFNTMASSIEDKIDTLDQELKSREFLIGALSHELKTPSQAVIGYAETIIIQPLTHEQMLECAQKILDAGKREEALSASMMELISLNDEAQVSKSMVPVDKLAEGLEENHPGKTVIEKYIETLYGEEVLLHSLLDNLVRNALRVSPEDCPVKVAFLRAEAASPEKPTALTFADQRIPEAGEYDIVQVIDQGIGIPPEHLSHLTEPFYRVDKDRSRKSGNAGLGLAVCQLIVEKHQGYLAFESTPGKGTCVTVFLPMMTT